jgi:hypothetical protein
VAITVRALLLESVVELAHDDTWRKVSNRLCQSPGRGRACASFAMDERQINT